VDKSLVQQFYNKWQLPLLRKKLELRIVLVLLDLHGWLAGWLAGRQAGRQKK